MAYNDRKGGGYGGGPRWQQLPQLPEGYLQGGYFAPAETGGRPVLRREYIIGYPEQIAKALDDRDKNKSSQLRKFYDYCIRIRDALNQGQSFQALEGDFCRLTGFVKYAEGRGRVTPLFVDFIQKNVEAVHSKEEFGAFIKHFEAVIAYIKK